MDEVSSFPAAPTVAALVLDLRGLKCPLPVLRARKALRRLAGGQALSLLCTDPLAAIDIPNLVREDGHLLAASTRSDGVFAFVIVKQNEVPPIERMQVE